MTHAGRQKEIARLRQDERGGAVSHIWAEEARGNSKVRRFREEVLGGKTLSMEEVGPWIRAQAAREGEARILVMELPADPRIEGWEEPMEWKTCLLERIEEAELLRLTTETLKYECLVKDLPKNRRPPHSDDNDSVETTIQIRRWGTLGRIKGVAETLCGRFPWSEAQVVTLILTDEAPDVPMARVTTMSLSLSGLPARVHMDLSPQTPVADVVRLFRRARAKTATGTIARVRRGRPLTKKRGELSVFLAQTPEATWRARMEQWNRRYPHWAYDDPRNFRRDAATAYKRATGEVWRNRQRRRCPEET